MVMCSMLYRGRFNEPGLYDNDHIPYRVANCLLLLAPYAQGMEWGIDLDFTGAAILYGTSDVSFNDKFPKVLTRMEKPIQVSKI